MADETDGNGQGVILVMDDVPSIRLAVGEIVRSLGFSVAEAGDGDEGLQVAEALARQGQPLKMVIADLYMPGCDGVSFIRAFRLQDKKTPILMLTTESDPAWRVEGKRAGANAWMVKPLNANNLFNLIRKFTTD